MQVKRGLFGNTLMLMNLGPFGSWAELLSVVNIKIEPSRCHSSVFDPSWLAKMLVHRGPDGAYQDQLAHGWPGGKCIPYQALRAPIGA